MFSKFLATLVLGVMLGILFTTANWENKAVKKGCARYSNVGKFEWVGHISISNTKQR
jgi:hypothetical protein